MCVYLDRVWDRVTVSLFRQSLGSFECVYRSTKFVALCDCMYVWIELGIV